MRRFLASIKYHLKDRLRFSPTVGLAASLFLENRARREAGAGGEGLPLLARAARACGSPRRLKALESRLRSEAENVDASKVDWDSLGYDQRAVETISKSIILKPPISERERGVLYVTFENQWLKLLRSGRASEIARRYDLVLGPTWSPPHDAALLLAAELWPGTLFSLVSNLKDEAILNRLCPNLKPVPLLASSWTNPDLYTPYISRDKTIDIVMVATFTEYKRHWLFFETLRSLPRDLRVVLIGRPVGARTEEVLRREARLFGVEDRFELWRGASDEDIARAICESRVSLIFSRQEGSCVAVAEALMGGCPVGLFRDARVGSRAFINSRTGVLLERRGLARRILDFLEDHDRFDPRSWAVENISCHVSSGVLNQALRRESEASGRPWTRDIATMYQNSVPLFVDPDDGRRMLPFYRDFRDRYGLEVVLPEHPLLSRQPCAVPLATPGEKEDRS